MAEVINRFTLYGSSFLHNAAKLGKMEVLCPLAMINHVELAYAEGRQDQSFRLSRPVGEDTGGFKTPGYSKTVLWMESAAAAPNLARYPRFQWHGQP